MLSTPLWIIKFILTHTFIPASFIYIYLAARHPGGGGGNSKTAPHTDVMCKKQMTRHQIMKIYVKKCQDSTQIFIATSAPFWSFLTEAFLLLAPKLRQARFFL